MNLQKKNNLINIILIFVLTIFSISINQYYGYQGILPIDSFLIFNSGYDFSIGYYPFRDYWTIKEPFIDFLQALFFKLFGVSWFVYVLHASIFNFLITICTFFILKFFNLDTLSSFFYSICVAALTYPTAGTPFSDHHTLILSILSLYVFFLAIKKDNNFFWFFLPILLGFSFLSKQAPTSYIILMISFLSLLFFYKKKNLRAFLFSILGSFSFLIFFYLMLLYGKIEFNDFFTQYILFPQSLGSSRLDWVLPFEFKRFVWRFKLLYLSITVFLVLLIRYLVNKKVKISIEDFIIILSIVFTCLLFIFHQLMTINAIFIYCLIPIFSGLSHSYSKMLNVNRIRLVNYSIIILTFCSSIYYFINYVQNRTFMDLRNVDFENSIDAQKINAMFKGVNWITVFYPNDPEKEIKKINLAINILNQDKERKMLITDYQFISVLSNQYDFSVTRFWYDFHGYPAIDNKYFNYWKNFTIENIKRNKIKNIYVLKPLHGEEKPLENIFGKCMIKKRFNENFYKISLKNCTEF